MNGDPLPNLITTPMDLRSGFPRSVREQLGGNVQLARMFDKCRSKLAGKLGEYIYPCPLDQKFMEFLGISEKEFLESVEFRSDQEILSWAQSVAKPLTSKEIDVWNQAFLIRAPDTDEKREYFNKTRDAIDPGRTDISSWADLLDLDENRPVPNRKIIHRKNT